MPATKSTNFGKRHLREGSSEEDEVISVVRGVVDVGLHHDLNW